jgi:hypothetical protein
MKAVTQGIGRGLLLTVLVLLTGIGLATVHYFPLGAMYLTRSGSAGGQVSQKRNISHAGVAVTAHENFLRPPTRFRSRRHRNRPTSRDLLGVRWPGTAF